MPYNPHPSVTLQNLFALRPWQGANPMEAKYIFIGLDANFAIDVERQIPEIVPYLENGPQFWIDTGRHHPFMLDAYNGSGRFYHNNFKLIDFVPAEVLFNTLQSLLRLMTYV